MKKNLTMRLGCALLALTLCLTAFSPALAAREEYTMAGKLLRQLWAGSGFSGTLEVSLAANEAAQGDALVTANPFLIDWDYIYVRPTTATRAEHRVDAALMDGETALSEVHMQMQDGVLSAQSPLLGEGWYTLSLEQLLQAGLTATEGTLAEQVTPAVQAALEDTGMPALLTLAVPQLLRWQEQSEGLQTVLEQMTLRMDLWIEGYRQNAVLGRLEDGSAIITVNYEVSPANIKAQAKQMVLDVLEDEAALSSLIASVDEKTAQLLLNPAYQPYYFAAIDALPLSGNLTLSRTVDMNGDTVALHLSLPFYDAQGGAMTLRYDRERGAGDLPDTNTLTLESAERSVTLSYLTYRSMTDVTVYQGTFKVNDLSAESFAVQPDGEEKWMPEVAFTLSRQTTETKEDGDLNVYTDNWQLTLEPDPNGKEPEAFLPLQLQLDSRFSSKTPQTSATKADITLVISGEERPQTVTLRFIGETRRQWAVEELPKDRTDLLAVSGDALEDLLATLLTEGSQVLGFFMESTAQETGVAGEAEPADAAGIDAQDAAQPTEAAESAEVGENPSPQDVAPETAEPTDE